MTIKPGDLVMVVRWPCCGSALGLISVVCEVGDMGGVECIDCGAVHELPIVATAADGYGAPVQWLKRIDPLREPEIIEERLAVKA